MSYDYGRFVWFELLTSEVEKLQAFYSEAFNWKVETLEMVEGMRYPLIKAGETPIGGFMQPPEPMPAQWLSYVSVEDVDASGEQVADAGGRTLKEPFDIPTVGRIQPVLDPQGALFALFHGEDGDPPVAQQPGAIHWNELWTTDDEQAVAFYSKVLGYETQTMPGPQRGSYHVLMSGESPRGGIMQAPAPGVAPQWVQYVTVEDCDATVARARKLGAEPLGEPMEMDGVGRFAHLKDPAGAIIGVIHPAQRD